MATILQARDVECHFDGRKPFFGKAAKIRAVDGIALEIEKGETFAIVGESGCGKSTLARLLAGLLSPTAGSVIYDGLDFTDLEPKARTHLRRDLQFIFQDPFSSLNPRMNAGALIGEPLRAHGLGDAGQQRTKVAQLLERVGLRPEHANRYPHEFSGGQRQRIGIARALASGPKVLIGDEPVSALDVSIQAQVINLLDELKDEFGLTLIIIAHDLTVIRHMADRVAVMYLGEIVELAAVDELFANPKHPYTQALIAAIPIASTVARERAAALEGDPPNPLAPPEGCRFHTRCAYAQERCSQTRPKLVGPITHQSACHRVDELTLKGLDTSIGKPSTALAKRFELYRDARAAAVSPTASP